MNSSARFPTTQHVKKLFVIMVLTLLTLAAAQVGHSRMGECRADMESFCSNESGPEKFQCLQSHINEVSDACKRRLEGHTKAQAACETDQEIFCSDMTGRNRFRCMYEHRDEVSTVCREAMDAQFSQRPRFR